MKLVINPVFDKVMKKLEKKSILRQKKYLYCALVSQDASYMTVNGVTVRRVIPGSPVLLANNFAISI